MYVFVYGTLKKGYANHHYLADQQFIGPAALPNHLLYAVSKGFPGVCPAPGRNHQVNGELYQVTAECLKHMDRLESNGRMYQRQLLDVTLSNSDTLPAWVYIWILPITLAMPAIDGPDWHPRRS